MLKKIALFVFLCFIGTASPLAAANDHKAKHEERVVPGRILVVPKAGLPEHDFEKLLKEHGGKGKGKKIGQSDIYVVELNNHGSERSIVARMKNNPHFDSAEVDVLVSPELIPNDPGFPSGWHLPKMNAPQSWDTAMGKGVTVAVIDSGVEATHPDLAASLVPGWNFYDNNSNTADVFGHGTKVAGASSAITGNGVGISSIAGQSNIMPLRVADTTGWATTSRIASAIIFAADNIPGPKVANASFGGIAGSATIFNAAEYMKSKGGLVVVSAGNGSVELTYTPSNSLIAVSATDENDNKTSWSNYGWYVDYGAPGANVLTTTPGAGYTGAHGTSFSSPVVAGVIALMWSANPSASNLDIERLLCETSADIGPMGKDIYFGCGRPNAEAAVLAAKALIPFVDTLPPTVDISSPTEGSTVSGLVPVSINAEDNVGVERVELRVNNNLIAVDTSAPFGFTWDSKGTVNGDAGLTATAYDRQGNAGYSEVVRVIVSNTVVVVPKDTTPPVLTLRNPNPGYVSGNNVAISTSATDNSGAAGITHRIYVDGILRATGTGSTLGYNWNLKKEFSGTHVIKATATDKAGNTSTVQISVTKR